MFSMSQFNYLSLSPLPSLPTAACLPPVSGLYSTHRLCVDALLAIIQAIEYNCRGGDRKPTPSSSIPNTTPANPRLLELQPTFGFGLRRWSSDPRMSSTANHPTNPPSYDMATRGAEAAGLEPRSPDTGPSSPGEAGDTPRPTCSASTLFGIDLSELLSKVWNADRDQTEEEGENRRFFLNRKQVFFVNCQKRDCDSECLLWKNKSTTESKRLATLRHFLCN